MNINTNMSMDTIMTVININAMTTNMNITIMTINLMNTNIMMSIITNKVTVVITNIDQRSRVNIQWIGKMTATTVMMKEISMILSIFTRMVTLQFQIRENRTMKIMSETKR